MSEAETENKRWSLAKKIKLAVLILVIVFAAAYVPAKFLAVKYTNRGTEFFNEGKLDEAMGQYELAMKIFPGFKPAREQLGRTCSEKAENAFNRNDYAEAKRLYERVMKLRFEVPEIHYKLATICWGQGENAEGLAEIEKHFAEGLVEIEKHLKENPNDSKALNLRSILQRGKKTKPPEREKEAKPPAERKRPTEEEQPQGQKETKPGAEGE